MSDLDDNNKDIGEEIQSTFTYDLETFDYAQ